MRTRWLALAAACVVVWFATRGPSSVEVLRYDDFVRRSPTPLSPIFTVDISNATFADFVTECAVLVGGASRRGWLRAQVKFAKARFRVSEDISGDACVFNSHNASVQIPPPTLATVCA